MKVIYKIYVIAILLFSNLSFLYSQNQPPVSIFTIPNDLGICETKARDFIYIYPESNTTGTYIVPYSSPVNISNVNYNGCFQGFREFIIDESIILPLTYSPPINPDYYSINTSSSYKVGTTNGSFNVDPTGGANYSIPIILPPGTAGMIPNISVNYSSQSGNGLLGFGWNLSGISAISRVGQNRYNDNNKITGVDFSTNDRFVLDGNRLILVSGTYGVSGSVYRTENETFSKIMFDNNKFIIYTKDGKTLEYDTKQGTYSLNIPAAGSEYLSWYLSKISDNNGNYINFYYLQSHQDNLSIRIDKIEYTGNTNSGLLPYNTVQFIYEKRPDVSVYYLKGYKGINDKILKKIKVYNENNLAHAYEFNYIPLTYSTSSTFYSLLNEIVEYGSDGSKYNSTILQYGDAGIDFQSTPIQPSPSCSSFVSLPFCHTFNYSSNEYDFTSGDFNGDGYSDIIALHNYLAPVSGIQIQDIMEYHENYKNDNFFRKSMNQINYQHIISGGQAIPSNDNYSIIKPEGIINTDFNNDGKEDYLQTRILYDNNFNKPKLDKIHVFYSTINTSGSSSYTELSSPSQTNSLIGLSPLNYGTNNTYDIIQGDFINIGNYGVDGATNIITALSSNNDLTRKLAAMYMQHQYSSIGNPEPYLISGIGNASAGNLFFGINDKLYTLDYNGDGKMDLMVVGTTSTFIYTFAPVYNSNGSLNHVDAISLGEIADLTLSNNFDFNLGDFNGDGKTDLLYVDNNGAWNVAYSKGGSSSGALWGYAVDFFDVIPIDLYQNNSYDYNYLSTGNYTIRIGDYNGDGKSDILLVFKNSHIEPILDPNTNQPTYYWDGNGNQIMYTQNVSDNQLQLAVFYSNCLNFTAKNSYYSVNTILGNPIKLISGDFNGDGKSDVIYQDEQNNFTTFYFNKFEKQTINNLEKGTELLLKQITNGLEQRLWINYDPITDNSIYTKGTTSVYPLIDIQSPIYVVSSNKTYDGVGGELITNYQYEGGKVHLQGKGFLGFSKFTKTDPNNITENEYEILGTAPDYLNFISVGLKKQTVSTRVGKHTISTTTNTYDVYQFPYFNTAINDRHIFQYLNFSETKNSITGIKTLTTNTFNNNTDKENGNIGSTLTQYLSGSTTLASTNEVYQTYITAGSWLPNKPLSSTITKTLQGNIISKTTSYSWDIITGSLNSETNFLNVRTDYSYDPDYGVLLSTTIIPAPVDNLPSRTVTLDYDAKKRFVTKTTKTINNINIINESQYDSKTGNVLWTKDENGLITTNSFDGFGQLLESVLPTGKKVKSSIVWDNGQTMPNAMFYTKIEGNGKPFTKVYKDFFGRTIRTESEVSNNLVINNNISTVFTDNIYNSKGQLEQKSYLDKDGNSQWTTYYYDIYNRDSLVILPNNTKITNTYSSSNSGYDVTTTLTDIATNNIINTKTTKTDLTGLTSSVIDNGVTIDYTYNAEGSPLSTICDGTTTTMLYNNFGIQTQLSDPNAVTMNYTYNSLGELTDQIEAGVNQYHYKMTYDILGRVLTKTLMNDNSTYTYTYDTETNGIGKIASITGPNGMSQQFKYDQYGRNVQLTEVIPGTNNLVTSYSYNDYGNNTQIIYPNGYTVNNIYDIIGTLTEVTSGNTSIWELDKFDYMGHITRYKTANGNVLTDKYYNSIYGNLNEINVHNIFNYTYVFDNITGNLTRRTDLINIDNNLYNLEENFQYDNFNRLTSASNFINSNSNNLNITYFNNGNINTKSDVSTVNNYNYTIPETYAVKYINDPANISPVPQDIIYNSFNKIKEITEGANKLTFEYGIDQQRRKMITYNHISQGNDILLKTKFYSGGYEKEVDANGNIIAEWNYIAGGDGLVAIYIKNVNNGNGALYYVAKDYLGSIMALYDGSGSVVEEFNYDAWGRRRDPANWQLLPDGTNPSLLIARGYTGHEHLNAYGIINMNGRLYDPLLGRMLSPDNFVQNSLGTQGFNRYSYCLNNPLKYTDPSGELIPIWIIPNFSFSPNSGLTISITIGLGMPGAAFIGVTGGYSFKDESYFVSLGGNYGPVSGSVGWHSTAGYNASLSFGIPGFGIPLGNNFAASTNMGSFGVSWSENGGLSANAFGFNYSFDNRSLSFDPSIGISYSWNTGFLGIRNHIRDNYSNTMQEDVLKNTIYRTKPKVMYKGTEARGLYEETPRTGEGGREYTEYRMTLNRAMVMDEYLGNKSEFENTVYHEGNHGNDYFNGIHTQALTHMSESRMNSYIEMRGYEAQPTMTGNDNIYYMQHLNNYLFGN